MTGRTTRSSRGTGSTANDDSPGPRGLACQSNVLSVPLLPFVIHKPLKSECDVC